MRKTILLVAIGLPLILSACGNAAADNASGDISPTLPASVANDTGYEPTNAADGSPTMEDVVVVPEDGDTRLDEDGMMKVDIAIGNRAFTAVFYDNDSARAIVQQMPFTLDMRDYAAQEKVAGLTFDLPSSGTETPATINAGELYLWSGNSLVLFYTSFPNSFSYIPIGHITDITGLIDVLGKGSIELEFNLYN